MPAAAKVAAAIMFLAAGGFLFGGRRALCEPATTDAKAANFAFYDGRRFSGCRLLRGTKSTWVFAPVAAPLIPPRTPAQEHNRGAAHR